ncbi:peptidylprolyl isomerase [Paraburkholderia phymatum]|uniref:peptidylprolyl isomerase n=1 Tax=Paraburkholderia phymatum (strain DSM 17167 / CIP 108236 / LMG 21445 / STM815) TaxID=391038 RepID=B2JWA8_PARP8|nr:peptidylprolyl isomerase [Paraburkholderia phymatum]ACC75235.1 PpiC-type peptidyl-prolyl cis-trans isomerase [Paraburkholderia phymatum STM815]
MYYEAQPVATVNAVPLHAPGEALPVKTLRQRACTELLRQAAIREGLLNVHDVLASDGTPGTATVDAIERLLEHALRVPEPDEHACRRYYAANPGRHAPGERVHARHILFAVTPGVDIEALRRLAEASLVDLRCDAVEHGERFARAAKELSNCPTGDAGGELGWFTAAECVPELARELFGLPYVGVLPRLVATRFGFHIVDVLARERANTPPFETVRAAIAQTLRQHAFANALRQYVSLLAAQAELCGVELDGTATPLVQ